MIKYLLLLSIFIMNSSIGMVIKFNKNQVLVGEIVEGTIELQQDEKLIVEKSSFLDKFMYIQDIQKDHEYRYYITAVPLLPIQDNHIFKKKIKDQEVTIQIQTQVYNDDLKIDKNFVFLEAPYSLPIDRTLLYSILGLVFIVASVVAYKFYNSYLLKTESQRKIKKKRRELIKTLNTATHRKEFEAVLSEIDNYVYFFHLPSKVVSKIKSDTYECRFKKDWSEEEENMVYTHVKKLKGLVNNAV